MMAKSVGRASLSRRVTTFIVATMASVFLCFAGFGPVASGTAISYSLLSLPFALVITLIGWRIEGRLGRLSVPLAVALICLVALATAYGWNLVSSFFWADYTWIYAAFFPILTLTFWFWWVAGGLALFVQTALTTNRRVYLLLAGVATLGAILVGVLQLTS